MSGLTNARSITSIQWDTGKRTLSVSKKTASLLFLFAVIALFAAPASLSAHAKLVRSDPKPGARLSAAPSAITLIFSEKPELNLSVVKLVMPTGDTVALTNLRRDSTDANVLIAEIPGAFESGGYQILWSAAARDGHASKGVILFSVVPPIATVADTAMMPDNHDDATIAVGGAIGAIIARWLSFISIFGVIGVIAFRSLILRKVAPKGGDLFSQIATTNAAIFGIVSAVGALIGAMLKLNRESADMPDISMSSMMFGSSWGVSLLLQVLGAIVAIVAFYYAHKSPNKNAWFAATLAAIALAISPSLGSHASTTAQPLVTVTADIVHVVVGSIWIGTLAVIMIVGISAALKTPDSVRPGARVALMINAFSPIALACGALIVFTGVIASVYHLKPISTLWTTPYGAALLFKLFFVVLLFAAGAWNWRRMKPRLTGDDAISPMRSSATLELVLAGWVLGITAILVALELP
jgi:copper transport protein